MPMDHISNESMRSYLLGQLSDDEATALEEEYFINRDSLLKIQAAETALIADYLDGSLRPAEKQHFESRYLHVPLLQRKVEEVRQQRRMPRPVAQPSIWINWRVAFAIASILVLAFGILAYRSHLATPPELVARNQPPETHSVIAIRISPGSVKGINSKPAQFNPPMSDSAISLVLELPGQSSSARCRVRISRVNSGGRWVPVWTSPQPLVSSVDGDGQALTVRLDNALVQPGDYVVQTTSSDSGISETYLYRVNKLRPQNR
jgi:hypothetical protein